MLIMIVAVVHGIIWNSIKLINCFFAYFRINTLLCLCFYMEKVKLFKFKLLFSRLVENSLVHFLNSTQNFDCSNITLIIGVAGRIDQKPFELNCMRWRSPLFFAYPLLCCQFLINERRKTLETVNNLNFTSKWTLDEHILFYVFKR